VKNLDKKIDEKHNQVVNKQMIPLGFSSVMVKYTNNLEE
jgi:hypothetical protein